MISLKLDRIESKLKEQLNEAYQNGVEKRNNSAGDMANYLTGFIIRELEIEIVKDDTLVEIQYGDHNIPESYKRIENVYIWFQAFNYSNRISIKRNTWNAIVGYVYETPDGTYLAPFRGELISVVKDTKDEFREPKKEPENGQ